jgi:glycerate kinase
LGAAVALGAQVFDRNQNQVFPRGETLQDVEQIDLSKIHSRLSQIKLTAICDVSNPFHGESGAAHVYAPQKGASAEVINQLDQGLQQVAGVILRQYGIDLQSVRGAGAGGGFAGGAHALMGAILRPGTDVVFEITAFKQAVEWADAVITGEGKLDAQTFHGKVIDGVVRMAMASGKDVYVVCGLNELRDEVWKARGIRDVYSLVQFAGPEMAMHSASGVTEDLANEIGRMLSKRNNP